MNATQHSSIATHRFNPLAVASILGALVAIAGMFILGTSAAAAFAVGAGHVSLYQLRSRGNRGRALALVGLITGYAVAVWSFILELHYIPTIATGLF